jgi:DNA topoisomerase-1
LPTGVNASDVTLEQALKLLSLPREVGKHPESGEPILAGVGRFGPYVQHGKIYATLEPGDDVLAVGLNRAVVLIAEKAERGGRGRRNADPGRPLGDHPARGGPIVAKAGRYGPYVSHDGVNATLPADKTTETITLEEAASLIDARAARGPAKRTTPKRRATKAPAARAAPGADKASPRKRAAAKSAAKVPATAEAQKKPARRSGAG